MRGGGRGKEGLGVIHTLLLRSFVKKNLHHKYSPHLVAEAGQYLQRAGDERAEDPGYGASEPANRRAVYGRGDAHDIRYENFVA